MRTAVASRATKPKHELLTLLNIGPAILGYLRELGVERVADLALASADDLYARIQAQRGVAFDPCLHDTFEAAILEARTGERRPWHSFTAARRHRQANGQFELRADGPQEWVAKRKGREDKR